MKLRAWLFSKRRSAFQAFLPFLIFVLPLHSTWSNPSDSEGDEEQPKQTNPERKKRKSADENKDLPGKGEKRSNPDEPESKTQPEKKTKPALPNPSSPVTSCNRDRIITNLNESGRLLELMKKCHPDSVRTAIEHYKKEVPSSGPTLPRDVWKLIFSYLPEGNAKTLGLVSKSWKSMTDQQRYRKADLTALAPELSSKEIQQRLEAVPQELRVYLEELDLSGLRVDDATLRWIFQNFPHLKKLTILKTNILGSAFLPPKEGEKELPQLEHLTYLPIDENMELVNMEAIFDYLGRDTQLKSYDLYLSPDEEKKLFATLSKTNNHLESFLYDDVDDLELRDRAADLIRSKPTLTFVTLKFQDSAEIAPLLHALKQNASNEISLELEGSLHINLAQPMKALLEANKISQLTLSKINDKATCEIVATALSRTSKLRSLNLRENPELFKQLNQKLKEHPNNTGKLDLDELWALGPLRNSEEIKDLDGFISQVPYLKKLRIVRHEMKESDFTQLLRRVPHLRFLSTDKITPEIVKDHPHLETLVIPIQEFPKIQRALVEKAPQLKSLTLSGSNKRGDFLPDLLKLIRDHPHLEKFYTDHQFTPEEWEQIDVALSRQPRITYSHNMELR